MKVVLKQDVPGLGKRGDVREVKAGYARNVLLPRKLVLVATVAALAQAAEATVRLEAQHQQRLVLLREQAKALAEKTLHFKVATGERGAVFGSVTARDIQTALHEQGFPDVTVAIDRPIKTTGEHVVHANLGEGITAMVKVTVEAIAQVASS